MPVAYVDTWDDLLNFFLACCDSLGALHDRLATIPLVSPLSQGCIGEVYFFLIMAVPYCAMFRNDAD